MADSVQYRCVKGLGIGTTRGIVVYANKATLHDFDSGLVKHVKNLLLSGVGVTITGADIVAGKAASSL
jgi:hypothetical protein